MPEKFVGVNIHGTNQSQEFEECCGPALFLMPIYDEVLYTKFKQRLPPYSGS